MGSCSDIGARSCRLVNAAANFCQKNRCDLSVSSRKSQISDRLAADGSYRLDAQPGATTRTQCDCTTTGDWKPKLVATRSNFAAQRFANCQTSSAAAAAEFLRLIEISHFTWVGIDLGEANMATNPGCVIKLMAIPARFLTVRASVRIRLIRRNWRQTFRHQNSLRMNRHE